MVGGDHGVACFVLSHLRPTYWAWLTVASCGDISHANAPTPLCDPKRCSKKATPLESARLSSHRFITSDEKYIQGKKQPQLYSSAPQTLPAVILIPILYYIAMSLYL